MLYHFVEDGDGWDGFKMTFSDALALEACILEAGDGDYLEVGVRKGGSAIFAGLVKDSAGQSGRIVGIDKMGDGMALKGVTADGAVGRAHALGVPLELIVAPSNPWPVPDIFPVVAVIDGDHTYEGCLSDWNNLKVRTGRFILFHDADHKGVAEVVSAAKGETTWKFMGQSGAMAVFECASS